MVLLSQFLSRLRAENVRSKVAYVKGIVKFIFKRVFWEPKGVGRSSPNFLPLPPPPPPATPPMFVADKCEETFDLVVFFYIKFCWRPATCFVARMLNVMFLYSRTIYILALLQTCLTYVFCCGTLLIYIGNHKIKSNFGYITTGKFFKDYFVVFDIYLRVPIYPKLLEKNQVITC